ncbi:MAG: menaquinone biosynthetic enzyme MqnA/MqnD family protein [Planctomycetota bacterium]
MRVGAVSYLNTKPLIYRFSDFAPDAELVLDVPSRLADRLRAGELDVALIPSVEALRVPKYKIVSNACIACRGPVLSVKLLSRVPIARIQTLALDQSSRTSVTLLRILLGERLGIKPHLSPLAIGDVQWESNIETDAVLVIGDRAIHASQLVYSDQWDLGQEWWQWTGLPFVFAMWMARPDVETHSVDKALRKSRDAGVAGLDAIAESAAQEVGLDAATCLSYLRDNLHFSLGTAEQQGLLRFHHYAVRFGFV